MTPTWLTGLRASADSADPTERLGAQIALYGMIAAALPQAWHAVNFAPAT